MARGIRSWRASASAAVALIALAAWQEAPRSILPEGVFDPARPPAPSPPSAPPAPAQPAAPDPAPASDPPLAPGAAPLAPIPTPVRPPAPGPAAPGAFDVPRPGFDLASTGILVPAAGGYGPATFAGSDARILARLMARLDLPIAARWAHIVLRRALASRVPTPAGVPAADWIAVRARLLMRMGEIDVAKAMVDPVPIDAYTPGLYRAAADIALAAADIPGLCPIALTGGSLAPASVWQLADAICASLAGDEITAANAFDALRRRGAVDPFDIALAERIASAGGGGRRSANLAWDEVDRLTLYRFGLAAAAGADIPERLVASAPSPAMGWMVRAPALPDTVRIAALLPAARQGIVSSDEAVGFYAALADGQDSGGVARETAALLRTAFAGADSERVEALRALWRGAGADRFGGEVLTAPAVLRLRPDARFAADAAQMMASAVAGGRADTAIGWARLAAADDDRAFAIGAAIGQPVDAVRFAEWARAERGRNVVAGLHRARLLLAILDAQGTASGDGWATVRADLATPRLANRWMARLSAAAAAGRRGEVALLAATGLQTSWAGVPPQHLGAILVAYARVGLTTEARLLAGEAMART